MKPAIDQVELLQEVSQLKTSYDTLKFFKSLCKDIGLESFIVFNLPSYARRLSDSYIISNWSPELLQVYDELALANECPMLDRVRHTTLPFTWSAEDLEPRIGHADTLKAAALFRSYDMNFGCTIPVHTCNREVLAACFSGRDPIKQPSILHNLHLISIHAVEQLRQTVSEQRKQALKLTPRERDCMIWTAAGKTSSEIALILSLSEHTVNHYLQKTCRKLDSVTRPQAIAKALRLGLIR
jgi:DNA-binding CsgD family transcriptional regulator